MLSKHFCFLLLLFIFAYLDSDMFLVSSMDKIDGDPGGHDTIIRYSYNDLDPAGPPYWAARKKVYENKGKSKNAKPKVQAFLGDKLYTKNHCLYKWRSPINIKPDLAFQPEVFIQTYFNSKHMLVQEIDDAKGKLPQTLILVVSVPDIETKSWDFGHPADTYHGIEVRPPHLGLFQIMDPFDPIGGLAGFTTFDFHFLSIFYCNKDHSTSHRSMHQIDGKSFPLELEFVFFRNPTYIGIDRSIDESSESVRSGKRNNIGVIVAVQGEISSDDNPYLSPIIQAASKFHGQNFGVDDMDESTVVPIKNPWSPTWLFPDSSFYYYYNDGTFPVPPCWKVSRYYVMKERINISMAQLNVLTKIRTSREQTRNHSLPCTHSIVQNEILPETVMLNPVEYERQGDDHKPLSEKEKKARDQRKKNNDNFRRRLAGQAIAHENKSFMCIHNPMFVMIAMLISTILN